MSTKAFGSKGEEIATKYLQKQGYQIVERNFRTRNGEIDIIAIDNGTKPQTLVFVEVKTREGDAFGTPFEAITSCKLKFLTRTAKYYSFIHPKLPDYLRIDAISVLLGESDEILDIEHIKNISQ